MAAISLPERGQPLDVNYIYELVTQINAINNQLAVRATSTSTVGTDSDTTSNLKFYAFTKPLTTTNASGNGKESFFFEYPDFKFPPIVTISIINNTSSEVTPGDNVVATLRKVATSRCDGIVRFNTSGAVNLSISMIAIGIAP
jgi:hypothetical protein